MCMCAKVCLHFLCVFVWETIRVHVTVRECMVDCYGCTSLELVHYSLTVFPSEIPGIGCVTHKHTYTQNIYTHTQTEKCTHSDSLIPDNCSAFLFCIEWRPQKLNCSAQEGETEIRERVERLPQGTERNHCHTFYSKITKTHLLTV